jgi:hypothetical protein
MDSPVQSIVGATDTFLSKFGLTKMISHALTFI